MSNRIQEINKLLKEEVSNALLHELGDHKGIVTVTAVDTTRDVRHSTVWFAIIGADETEITNLIKEKQKTIQQIINHRLHMKYVPKIDFEIDRSGSYADEIARLIKEAKEDK